MSTNSIKATIKTYKILLVRTKQPMKSLLLVYNDNFDRSL